MYYLFFQTGDCQSGDHYFGNERFQHEDQARKRLAELTATYSPYNLSWELIEGVSIDESP